MALPRWPNQFILFCLISLVQAYTVFETNCSVPATLSNYVSSPNTRGTLDILWSSLFTIFACTWSVQHPNVPEQRDVDGKNPRGWRAWIRAQQANVKWELKGFYRSTLRMLWTVIAPELIVVAACGELMNAHMDCNVMQTFVSEDGFAWSLTHSYYANMGGFVVRNPSADKKIYHDPYHLTGKKIFSLRSGGYITKLPNITEAEIKDKSKGDMLGKMIALGQIAWSTIQIIVRVARKLPVSPLEVAVVAFAVCAVLIYILYWKKPQRVGVTQTIQLNDNPALYDEYMFVDNNRILKGLFQHTVSSFGIPFEEPLRGAPISVDSTCMDRGSPRIFFIVSASAALFGGIHAVAWNFAFPTRIELVFWRCASIYTAAAPFCIMLLLFLSEELPSSTRLIFYLNKTLTLVAISFIVLYPIARLFIIVEMFRTLYFLPPGSFISTWTSNVPHLA